MVTTTMIKKVLPFEVKEVSPRVLEFTGSTEDKDRMGDIIVASGWQLKHYKKNPVFLWAHQYDDPPVGKAVKVWVDEDKLKFHIQFAEREEYEFADTIYKLYKGGYLRATSVGFMPLESEPIEVKDDEYFLHQPTKYIRQDLLELSGCPVPANPNALAEAKSMGLITIEQYESLVEDEVDIKPYPNEHACRLRNPDDFQDGSFKRTEREHEGKRYSVIMGRLEGEDTMTEQAYRYDKDVWSAGEARTHCKDHDGNFEAAEGESSLEDKQSIHPSEISQEQIADEIDFLIGAVVEEGLNDDNAELAWVLVNEVLRLRGSDIPLDIAEKIGAVLNKANRERLEKIKVLAQEVLDSAEREDEPEPEKSEEPEITEERIAEIVSQVCSTMISKAQGKITRR